jgi:hypothetical protein
MSQICQSGENQHRLIRPPVAIGQIWAQSPLSKASDAEKRPIANHHSSGSHQWPLSNVGEAASSSSNPKSPLASGWK